MSTLTKNNKIYNNSSKAYKDSKANKNSKAYTDSSTYKNKVDSSSGRLMAGITSAFLLYMLVAYPLALHDHYFDITYTKYVVFRLGVVLFAIIWSMGLIIVCTSTRESGMSGSTKRSASTKISGAGSVNGLCNRLCATDICMVLFLLSGIMAFVMSEDKQAAYTGAQGRYCGLAFVILVFIMYIIVSARISNVGKWWHCISMVFVAVAVFTFAIAILQNMGLDPFHLLDGINRRQRNIYVSTFGNIDIFGSFICIALPLFMGLYITENRLAGRILYGIGVFTGFMAFIPANADAVYAGIGTTIIALIFVNTYMPCITRFLELVMLGSGGYLSMVVLRKLVGTNGAKITGFNRISEHQNILILVFVAALLVRITIEVYINVLKNKKEKTINCEKTEGKEGIHGKKPEGKEDIYGKKPANTDTDKVYIKKSDAGKVYINKSEKKGDGNTNSEKKTAMGAGRKLIALIAGIVVLAVIIIVYGIKNNLSVFDFSDKWGSYRGYIWKRVVRLYGELPFAQKIFGHGNESVRSLMDSHFYDEMLAVTGTVYDNAHNEYLQYLITQGLFGMLSYVGAVITAVIAGAKKIKNSPYICGLLLAVVSYATQAVFNVNQCITTPYMFLMLAMLVGVSRE